MIGKSIKILAVLCLFFSSAFAESDGVLMRKPVQPSAQEMEFADEFIDIQDAIRLNGTFGPSGNYDKKMRSSAPVPQKQKVGEDVLVNRLPRGREEAETTVTFPEKAAPEAPAQDDAVLPEKTAPGKDEIILKAVSPEQQESRSVLLDGETKEQNLPMKKTVELHDEKAPPIEDVRQKEYMDEDDPFLTRKDVTAIPFKFSEREKPCFFFSLSNRDDIELWKDLRKNRDANAAILDGRLEIVLPSFGESDIIPLMVYHYALESGKDKAVEFLDWTTRQPRGWMDVKYADYLNEQEKKERKFEIEADIDQWMREKGLDTDMLYSDRGTQMRIAKKINADTKKYKKTVRGEKHPCVYVNGRERSGYFESIRSLPMHQR